MKIENPLAYSFIMQDELYLLENEKGPYALAAQLPTVANKMPEVTLPLIETRPLSFNYLGANKKAFLVVAHSTGAEFMDDAHLTALTAVLGRLQHTTDDVAIFNLATNPDAAFDLLLNYFKPQKLLFLGTMALPKGLEPIALNKRQQVSGIPALFSFSFDEMMMDNDRKKMFWEQMKQL